MCDLCKVWTTSAQFGTKLNLHKERPNFTKNQTSKLTVFSENAHDIAR